MCCHQSTLHSEEIIYSCISLIIIITLIEMCTYRNDEIRNSSTQWTRSIREGEERKRARDGGEERVRNDNIQDDKKPQQY